MNIRLAIIKFLFQLLISNRTKHLAFGVNKVSELRLEEWRKTASCVTEAQKISSTPAFQSMLAVLRLESPVNYQLPTMGPSDTDSSRQLGRIEGYQLALNNLEAMATPPPLSQEIEATFERELNEQGN